MRIYGLLQSLFDFEQGVVADTSEEVDAEFFSPGNQLVYPVIVSELTENSIRAHLSPDDFELFKKSCTKLDVVSKATIPIVLQILRGEIQVAAADRQLLWEVGAALAQLELSAPALFASARSLAYSGSSVRGVNDVLGGALCRIAVLRDRIVSILRVG